MSIQFCDYCNQYIDTEKDAEHFEECENYFEQENEEAEWGGNWPDRL